jgi:hypothetical protein
VAIGTVATTGAGSVVTYDVSLGVAGARQPAARRGP